MTTLRTPDPPVAPEAAARVRRRDRPGGRRRRNQSEAFVFLTPWLLGAVALTVGPMVVSLYLSFTDYDMFTAPHWVGFGNLTHMFTDDDRYLQSVKVTLIYVLVSVPLKLTVSLLVAMLLNTRRGANGFYRAAFYAPSLLGASVAAALVWRALFMGGGPVNEVLAFFGWHTPSWVDDPQFSLASIVLLGGVAVRRADGDLPGRPQADPGGAARGGGGRRRGRVPPVPAHHAADAVAGDLLQPGDGGHPRVPGLHPGVRHRRRTRRPGRRGPVLHALPVSRSASSDFRMGYASAMAWVLLVVIAIVTAIVFRTAKLWVFYDDAEERR